MNEPARDDGHGDVRTDSEGLCSVCHGEAGHHHLHCPNLSKSQSRRRTAQGEKIEELLPPEEMLDDEAPASVEDQLSDAFDEHKVPPTGDDIVSSDMMWLVAKLCHEVNRVYCQSIADWSQPEWDSAPDWQRESAFNGVTMHFENPEATAEDSHKSWLAEKAKDGWVYGPVKDAGAKTHPCFVPYNQLPPAQQYKDELFKVICNTFFGSDAAA